jgi:hypothetical protein
LFVPPGATMFTLGSASRTPWEPQGTIFVTQVFEELRKRVSTELDRKLSTQTSCWEVVRSAEWTRFDKLVNTAKKNIWGAGKSLKVSQNQVHNWAVALSCLDIEAVQFIKTVLECIRDHPGNLKHRAAFGPMMDRVHSDPQVVATEDPIVVNLAIPQTCVDGDIFLRMQSTGVFCWLKSGPTHQQSRPTPIRRHR